MNLNQIPVAIRHRNSWEAVDLGFLMVRCWWKPLYTAWFTFTLPCFLVFFALFQSYGWVPPLLMWWLKPFWERIPLHILSHALFGKMPPFKQVVKNFPKFAFRESLSWLSIRRLNPTRSYDLPTTQLEGLTGAARRRRLRVLHMGNDSSVAFWLTCVCVHIEIFLYVAAFSLAFMFMPQLLELDWLALIQSQDNSLIFVNSILSYLCMSCVAPFYVAAGFSLYLNRRTHLEAWDIELVFRQLKNRLTDKPSTATRKEENRGEPQLVTATPPIQ